MTLFDEIYGAYYLIVEKILEASHEQGITLEEMQAIAKEYGYEETDFHLIPRLISGEWNLLRKEGNRYYSKLANANAQRPLSHLEKQWLKALLQEPKLQLFLTPQEENTLAQNLEEYSPLYSPKSFTYYDQWQKGDPYEKEEYQRKFRRILQGLEEKRVLHFQYETDEHISEVTLLPWKFSYSAGENLFRLLGATLQNGTGKLQSYHVRKMKQVQLGAGVSPQEEDMLQQLVSTPPKKKTAVFLLTTERNALERCMLHFASYEKQTTFDPDTQQYTCRLAYLPQEEEELLNQILSFGPVLQLQEPPSLLHKLRERVEKQINLLGLTFP